MTGQRRAILDALQDGHRPLSPSEVLEAASEAIAGINLSTIYRNLKSLVERGDVIVVPTPGDSSRYELAGLAHHHHFLCEQCGRLFDMHGCPGSFAGIAPKGFKVRSHELTLMGTCSSCTP